MYPCKDYQVGELIPEHDLVKRLYATIRTANSGDLAAIFSMISKWKVLPVWDEKNDVYDYEVFDVEE